MCLWCYSECISTPGKLKNLPDHGGKPKVAGSIILADISHHFGRLGRCDSRFGRVVIITYVVSLFSDVHRLLSINYSVL